MTFLHFILPTLWEIIKINFITETNEVVVEEFAWGYTTILEEEMAMQSSTLDWEISWTEEPGGLQFTGSQRVGRDWAHTQRHTTIKRKPILWTLIYFTENSALNFPDLGEKIKRSEMDSDCQWTNSAKELSAINNETATNTENVCPVNVVLFEMLRLLLQSNGHTWNYIYYICDFGQVT